MRHQLRLLATAATFFTRLPWVARWCYPEPERLGESARYFPLIGLLVGALGALVYALALLCWSPGIAAALALIATALVTGAFHEDGLSDAIDGFGGGYSVARKLEIMKDSRIGSFGALALVLICLLKWQALSELAGWAPLALLMAHVLARWAPVALSLSLPYVRFEGPNKPIAETMGPREGLWASLWVLSLVPLSLALAHVLSDGVLDVRSAVQVLFAVLATTLLCTWLCARWFRSEIGGITGDTLGAANQIVETTVYLAVLAVLGAKPAWPV